MTAQEERGGLPVLPFPSRGAFEAWLAMQPRDHPGVWVKLAKKGSDADSVTQSEMVDACLAHGWIDGLINAWDERWYIVRCTPRRPKSKWSKINVERVEALVAAGRMTPAGLAEVERAKADGRWDAAYPPASRMEVPDDLRAALGANPQAAAAFQTLDAANRYAILYRLHDAKKPETRARRIEQFVAMLAEGRRIHG
ncbi:MAG TPA: YdeI/OmpD-associated family protein [Caulobacteraceae bacterium]